MADITVEFILRMQDEASAKVDALKDKMATLSTSVNKVGKSMAIGGAAILGTLGLMTKRISELGDDIEGMAAKTGVSVETLSKLRVAGELSGVGFDKMQGSIVKLQDSLAKTNPVFAQLGIATRDSVGGIRDAGKVLEDLSASLQGMNPADQIAAVRAAMGKGGADMLPWLKQGHAARKALDAEAERLGAAWSKVDVAAADRLADETMKIGFAAEGLGKALLKDLMPALTDLVVMITNGIVAIKNFAQAHPTLTANIIMLVAGLGALMLVIGSGMVLWTKIAALWNAGKVILLALKVAFSQEAIAAAAAWVATLGPFALIVAGLALIGGGIYLLVKNWDWLREQAARCWNFILNLFGKGVPDAEIKLKFDKERTEKEAKKAGEDAAKAAQAGVDGQAATKPYDTADEVTDKEDLAKKVRDLADKRVDAARKEVDADKAVADSQERLRRVKEDSLEKMSDLTRAYGQVVHDEAQKVSDADDKVADAARKRATEITKRDDQVIESKRDLEKAIRDANESLEKETKSIGDRVEKARQDVIDARKKASEIGLSKEEIAANREQETLDAPAIAMQKLAEVERQAAIDLERANRDNQEKIDALNAKFEKEIGDANQRVTDANAALAEANLAAERAREGQQIAIAAAAEAIDDAVRENGRSLQDATDAVAGAMLNHDRVVTDNTTELGRLQEEIRKLTDQVYQNSLYIYGNTNATSENTTALGGTKKSRDTAEGRKQSAEDKIAKAREPGATAKEQREGWAAEEGLKRRQEAISRNPAIPAGVAAEEQRFGEEEATKRQLAADRTRRWGGVAATILGGAALVGGLASRGKLKIPVVKIPVVKIPVVPGVAGATRGGRAFRTEAQLVRDAARGETRVAASRFSAEAEQMAQSNPGRWAAEERAAYRGYPSSSEVRVTRSAGGHPLRTRRRRNDPSQIRQMEELRRAHGGGGATAEDIARRTKEGRIRGMDAAVDGGGGAPAEDIARRMRERDMYRITGMGAAVGGVAGMGAAGGGSSSGWFSEKWDTYKAWTAKNREEDARREAAKSPSRRMWDRAWGDAAGMTGMASGGPVSANKPYMVGERGQELFVPAGDGYIIPNKTLSGAHGFMSHIKDVIGGTWGFLRRILMGGGSEEIDPTLLPGLERWYDRESKLRFSMGDLRGITSAEVRKQYEDMAQMKWIAERGMMMTGGLKVPRVSAKGLDKAIKSIGVDPQYGVPPKLTADARRAYEAEFMRMREKGSEGFDPHRTVQDLRFRPRAHPDLAQVESLRQRSIRNQSWRKGPYQWIKDRLGFLTRNQEGGGEARLDRFGRSTRYSIPKEAARIIENARKTNLPDLDNMPFGDVNFPWQCASCNGLRDPETMGLIKYADKIKASDWSHGYCRKCAGTLGLTEEDLVRLQGIKRRRKGGTVDEGDMYLVGEDGPEAFIPWSKGFIVPDLAESLKKQELSRANTRRTMETAERTKRAVRDNLKFHGRRTVGAGGSVGMGSVASVTGDTTRIGGSMGAPMTTLSGTPAPAQPTSYRIEMMIRSDGSVIVSPETVRNMTIKVVDEIQAKHVLGRRL